MGVFMQPRDVAAIRQSGAILAAALVDVARAVAPGVTTEALDRIAASAIRQRGGTGAFLGYLGFPKTLCVSLNDEVVHGIPRADRRLQLGDVVSLDLGVVYQGIYTDAACSLSVGPADPATRRLLSVTREALRRAVAGLRPGQRTGDLGALVQAYVESHGCGVVRDLVGHGIGRQLHEEPKVPNFGTTGMGETFVRGQLLAIEPMVTDGDWRVSIAADGWTVRTRDGSRAAHFEQTVYLTDHGAEVMTPYGQDLEP